jgi:Na+/H+ antiporter NhaD/arsenite permease-like protein
MDGRQIAGLIVVAVTLAGVAVGRFPRLRMNRATIALVGATLLVAIGAISMPAALAAIDLDTLAMLFGMMVLNANLRLAGFFDLVAHRIAERAHGPRGTLALVVGAAGALSAVFLNDTVVLVLTPLVIDLAVAMGRRPVPYLVALATAANVGSVATLVGNPQNMLIGTSSGIPFGRFTLALAPVAIAGLVVVWAVVAWVYRPETGIATGPPRLPARTRVFRPLLRKCGWASLLLVAAIAAGAPLPLAALLAASLLLVTRRLKPDRVFRELDWSLLVFFGALFVVVAALDPLGVTPHLLAMVAPLADGGVVALTLVAAALSNLVSNVPTVLLLRPAISMFADPELAWLTLAMATTLAGNLTLLGSVANLIVAELAQGRKVRLGFWEYLKAGVPITLLTLALGVVWLGATH